MESWQKNAVASSNAEQLQCVTDAQSPGREQANITCLKY